MVLRDGRGRILNNWDGFGFQLSCNMESAGLSLDLPEDDGLRLNRSQAFINLNRLRVDAISLTLSLIKSKVKNKGGDPRNMNRGSPPNCFLFCDGRLRDLDGFINRH